MSSRKTLIRPERVPIYEAVAAAKRRGDRVFQAKLMRAWRKGMKTVKATG